MPGSGPLMSGDVIAKSEELDATAVAAARPRLSFLEGMDGEGGTLDVSPAPDAGRETEDVRFSEVIDSALVRAITSSGSSEENVWVFGCSMCFDSGRLRFLVFVTGQRDGKSWGLCLFVESHDFGFCGTSSNKPFE